MPQATLDHLVVAANCLEDGIRHVADALDIDPSPGGRHEHMNTHNALLRLGERTYLEVIAIDPEAGPPDAPRWFDLDGEATRQRLAEQPCLLTWVARCEDLEATTAAVPWDAGPIRRMYRGDMTWQIAFPGDGRLTEGGLLPPLIEWDAGASHPAGGLPERGCGLVTLRGFHREPQRIREALASVGLDADIDLHESVESTRLEALIETPNGTRTLT